MLMIDTKSNMCWAIPPSQKFLSNRSSASQVRRRSANKLQMPVRIPSRAHHGVDLINHAVKAGATALVPEDLFPIAQPCVVCRRMIPGRQKLTDDDKVKVPMLRQKSWLT